MTRLNPREIVAAAALHGAEAAHEAALKEVRICRTAYKEALAARDKARDERDIVRYQASVLRLQSAYNKWHDAHSLYRVTAARADVARRAYAKTIIPEET